MGSVKKKVRGGKGKRSSPVRTEDAGRRKAGGSDAAPNIHKVELTARQLLTIDAESLDWSAKHLPGDWAKKNWKGAIVRVQPPADATDERLAELDKWLTDAGVAIIRFDSRARGASLVATQLDKKTARAGAREVVMARAEQSKRKDELKALLDAELLKVGL